ncbi:MAG: homoserine O-acetyltransferase [Fimbriimonadaceae bacterium]
MPEIDPALFQENERTAPAADGRSFACVGSLDCENGGHLGDVIIAFETWGALNSSASNAILIQHAISGDSHAIGWWDRMIGPGKAIDTERFFVIGHNALGGCQGSTGPGPLGSTFPKITIGDMVTAQERLLAQLGIVDLFGVAGGSMGGHLCLEWARRSRVQKAFITAGCLCHSPMQIGINEAARQAIMRDPKWRGGDYGDDPPCDGLSVARMIGHISYLSDASFTAKFGRNRQDGKDQFQVESYLNYQGDKFTSRFDANSLLVLSRAIDDYECRSLEGTTTEFLVTSFTSDWLYTPAQGRAIHELALGAGAKSQFELIDLPYGHDAFLLDGEMQGAFARDFFG